MSWCCLASKAGARVHMAMAFISQLLAMCLMCLEPLRVTVCTPEGEESDLASGSARRPQLGVLSKGTRVRDQGQNGRLSRAGMKRRASQTLSRERASSYVQNIKQPEQQAPPPPAPTGSPVVRVRGDRSEQPWLGTTATNRRGPRLCSHWLLVTQCGGGLAS